MDKRTWEGLESRPCDGKAIYILHLVLIISHLDQNNVPRNLRPSILVPPIWSIPWQPCWNYKSHPIKLKTSQWFTIGLKINPNISEPPSPYFIWLLSLHSSEAIRSNSISSNSAQLPYLTTLPHPTHPNIPLLRTPLTLLQSPSLTSKQKWVWALLCSMHWF